MHVHEWLQRGRLCGLVTSGQRAVGKACTRLVAGDTCRLRTEGDCAGW